MNSQIPKRSTGNDTAGRIWGIAMTFVKFGLILGIFYFVPIVMIKGAERWKADSPVFMDEGFLIFITTLTTGGLAGWLTLMFIRQTGVSPTDILYPEAISAGKLIKWMGVVMILVAVYDGMSIVLGKEIVPNEIQAIFDGARFPFLLFLSFVILAPLLEELVFRGFLLEQLGSVIPDSPWPILISAFIWAVAHSQYGMYECFAIFLMGIVIGEAFIETRSLSVCILMHGVLNLTTIAEIYFLR